MRRLLDVDWRYCIRGRRLPPSLTALVGIATVSSVLAPSPVDGVIDGGMPSQS